MSTTFGVKIDKSYIKYDLFLDTDDDMVEVAMRGNGTGIRFINSLATILSDDTKVVPLDNSAQGIHTIGDIKREINKQNNN